MAAYKPASYLTPAFSRSSIWDRQLGPIPGTGNWNHVMQVEPLSAREHPNAMLSAPPDMSESAQEVDRQ